MGLGLNVRNFEKIGSALQNFWREIGMQTHKKNVIS
jgi:hypothetical protein